MIRHIVIWKLRDPENEAEKIARIASGLEGLVGQIDGLISAVAALCACRICPDVRAYLVPSHASFEIGYKLAMDEMRLEPMLLLGMRLGEGSGCPLAFEVLDAACAVINDMATFDEAGIDEGYLDEIREGDKFTVEGAR